MDLTAIYRTLHPTAAEYTVFSNVHGTLSRKDCMLDHTVLKEGKLENPQIEINTLLNNQWVKEIKRNKKIP